MNKHLELENALKAEGFLKFPYHSAKDTRTVGGYELFVDKRRTGYRAKFVILCDSVDSFELAKDVVNRTVPEAHIERGHRDDPNTTHGGPEIAMLTVTFRE